VWCWDITYLNSPIRGKFFYLYAAMDVFSRKIVAAEVHPAENSDLAAAMIARAARAENIAKESLVLHSDNGGPMKGATLLATLQRLGVMTSFSRPRVSDDNPYSEALFRTAKYRPEYPDGPFPSIAAAARWTRWFLQWYNHEHLHSGIRFVTPAQRHDGLDHAVLQARRLVYEAARASNPHRWSRRIRDWSRIDSVRLNPAHASSRSEVA
jgi:transposase InsO family protein